MVRNIGIERRICDFFKDRSQIQTKSINLLFFKDADARKYCEDLLEDTPQFESLSNVIKSIVKEVGFKHCKRCGKTLKFGCRGSFCSAKCKNNDEEKIEKQKASFRRTIEECTDRDEILANARKKREETCLERYGFKSNFQCDSTKEKSRMTCLKRHGVEHPSQNEEIRQKQLASYEATMKEHHDEIVSKMKKTIEEKHGGYFWNSAKEREKSRLHQLWLTILSYSEYVKPMFEEPELDHISSKKVYKWRCSICGNEFESHLHKTMHIPELPYLPRCLKCYPLVSGFSNEEQELMDFVHCYFPNAHKDRKMIHPLELDIVVDELKLAIEFNGCYHHSVESGIQSGYHFSKTLMCEERGYRLVHIWEDEWIDHKEEVKKKLQKLFIGEEDLSFSDDTIKLDRCWFSKLQRIPGYKLVEETKPDNEIRRGHVVENCGFLVYKKTK